MVIGLYISGDSLLHKASAEIKLSALFLLSTTLALVPYWYVQAIALLITLLLWLISGIGIALIRQIGWMIMLFVLMAVSVNGYFGQWEHGFVMGLRILTLVLLSMLVTYTTTLDEMTRFITRIMYPLKFIGINPALIGLSVSFCLRFIPLLIVMMGDIREAQISRGQKAYAWTLTLPLIIRLLRTSDEVVESLEARGFNAKFWS